MTSVPQSDPPESTESAEDVLGQLAEEFVERHRKGEYPSITEFIQRSPENEDEIKDLFPTIAAMEGLKLQKQPQVPHNREAIEVERIGDFQIVQEIGRGGMGVVFEAIQESLNRRVALKVLAALPTRDSKIIQRFYREATTAGKLHHTNIVPVFGVGESDGHHYYVMQLIDGLGLDEILAENQDTSLLNAKRDLDSNTEFDEASRTDFIDLKSPEFNIPNENFDSDDQIESNLEVANQLENKRNKKPVRKAIPKPGFRQIARIGIQAARALQYAHEQGTLHRDIKPANLLLDNKGNVWVADFGLAKAIENDDLTQSGQVLGTLRYMAPEQFQGKSDFRSDVYSLGLTLYELIILDTAWNSRDHSQLVDLILNGKLAPLKRENESVPKDLATIILKSVARRAEHRYQSAEQFADDLEAFIEGRTIKARRVSVVEKAWRWSRRNPIIAALSSATTLLLIILSGTLLQGYQAEKRERLKAESTANLALESLGQIFERFAPNRIDSSNATQINDKPVLSEETAVLLSDLLTFYDELATVQSSDVKYQTKSALARIRVGDINQQLGNYEKAIVAYSNGIEKLSELTTQTVSSSEKLHLKFHQLIAQNEIGISQRKLDLKDKSQATHTMTLNELISLESTEQMETEIDYEIARTHFLITRRPKPKDQTTFTEEDLSNLLDSLEFPESNSTTANENEIINSNHLEEAIRILEPYLQSNESPPYVRNLLAICYRNLDIITHPDSEEKAIQILRDLVEQYPTIPEYRLELANTLTKNANFDQRLSYEEKEQIRLRLKEAIKHGIALEQDHPNVIANTLSLIESYKKSFRFLKQSAQGLSNHEHFNVISIAENHIREAIALQTQALRRFPATIIFQIELAKMTLSLHDMLERQDKLDESKNTLTRTLELIKPNEDKYPILSRLSSEIWSALADVYDRLDNNELAIEATMMSQEAFEKSQN